MSVNLHTLRGDTLVEVVLAFAIFSAVSVASILAMNGSLARSETAIEITQARTEIDAQAEAIRFIHNAYGADNGSDKNSVGALWNRLSGIAAANTSSGVDFPSLANNSCASLYDTTSGARSIYDINAFVINYRDLSLGNADALVTAKDNPALFSQSSVYPRLVFSDASNTSTTDGALREVAAHKKLFKAEGIFVFAAKGEDSTFYDFYIYTCWDAPGSKVPTTIGTVLRLYNVGGV